MCLKRSLLIRSFPPLLLHRLYNGGYRRLPDGIKIPTLKTPVNNPGNAGDRTLLPRLDMATQIGFCLNPNVAAVFLSATPPLTFFGKSMNHRMEPGSADYRKRLFAHLDMSSAPLSHPTHESWLWFMGGSMLWTRCERARKMSSGLLTHLRTSDPLTQYGTFASERTLLSFNVPEARGEVETYPRSRRLSKTSTFSRATKHELSV